MLAAQARPIAATARPAARAARVTPGPRGRRLCSARPGPAAAIRPAANPRTISHHGPMLLFARPVNDGAAGAKGGWMGPAPGVRTAPRITPATPKDTTGTTARASNHALS